jgi:uncharacterized phage protein (TIGR01671 family)
MRDIKFRCWDRANKNMCGVKLIGGGYLWTDEKWLDSVCVNLQDNVHEIDVTCDVMQFTGLKDRHGREIYEGDILKVKLNDILSEVAPVEYRKDGFFWFGYNLSSVIHEGEVIGNIYENKELLEAK